MNPDLQKALAEGVVLVTGNRRLSRALARDYAAAREAAGERAWETPTILPWSAWLNGLWVEALGHDAASVLLGSAQERMLWERVIRESRIGSGLLNIPAAAAGVAEAWALLHAWDLPMPRAEDYPGEDAAAFVQWAQAYSRLCERGRFMDAARLPGRLRELAQRGELPLPERVLLAGIDELTPRQRALLEAFAAAGVSVEHLPPPAVDGTRVRVTCTDAEEELARAAGWARDRLAECGTGGELPRIAVVVPALAQRRAQAMRIFGDILHPGRVLPGASREQRAFNVSFGRPLTEYPVVRAAFNILRLAGGRVDGHELGTLLRSPFVAGGDSEAAARAEVDARLREHGERDVWLADLIGMARGRTRARHEALAPVFLKCLDRLFVRHREAAGRRLAGAWAQLFSRCLDAMGWPGERGLSSAEYQTVEAWSSLLERFAGLDVVAAPMTAQDALAELRRLAASTPFQPQSPPRPVQIMGLLEAAGQDFDHLWIAGLDDETWPPAACPNPWLPPALQRRHSLPHSSPARERDYAERVTKRLLAAAPEVVVSHARLEEARERHASPLIARLPERAAAEVAEADTLLYRDLIHARRDLETLTDVQAPPLPEGIARGGTGVLRAQAACPFQAFARYRLGAWALEESHTGADARERGKMVHDALESAWAAIGDAEHLRAAPPAHLERLAGRAAERAVTAAAHHRPRTYTKRFQAIAISSLQRLLLDWLRVEAERPDFTVVAREEKREIEVGGLRLRVILDRVDRLRDGRHLILDYKTGDVRPGAWEGERPDEPQLPAYALAASDIGLAGVAFARVRAGSHGFAGVTCDEELLPDATVEDPEDWDRRLDEWRGTLAALARDYRAGTAAVDPKNPTACRYCDLHGLCRIHEAGDMTVRRET